MQAAQADATASTQNGRGWWANLKQAIRLHPRATSAHFTSEGSRFVFFTLAVGVAAINTGNNLFYLLVAMMLSLIMMSGVLSELCLRRLTVSCHAPSALYAGQVAWLTVAITNDKRRLPSFSLRLAEVIAGTDATRQVMLGSVGPGATVMARLPIQFAARGRYALHGISLTTPYPFGLFTKRRFLRTPMALTVLPHPEPLPADLLRDRDGHGADHRTIQRGSGTDLYNLRLYQPGDDSRLIHWMSTARTSLLMVRETQADREDRLRVVLLPWQPPTDTPNADQTEQAAAFERAVGVAASLVWEGLRNGAQVDLQIGHDTTTAPHGTRTHRARTVHWDDPELTRLLMPLALCEAQPAASQNQTLSDTWQGATIVVAPSDVRHLLPRLAPTTMVLVTDQSLVRIAGNAPTAVPPDSHTHTASIHVA